MIKRSLFFLLLALACCDSAYKEPKTEHIIGSLILLKSKTDIELILTEYNDSIAGYFSSAQGNGLIRISSDSRFISGRMCIVTHENPRNILSGTWEDGNIVLYKTNF